jgi:hypothetical protein
MKIWSAMHCPRVAVVVQTTTNDRPCSANFMI